MGEFKIVSNSRFGDHL